MARVSIYLNFMGNTEEAFAFYADAFGTEVTALQRFGDVPMPEGAPAMSSEDQAKVLHIEVPILAGAMLMGTDMLESMGHELRIGNNTTINLEFDTPAEATRLYELLSVDATDATGLTEMFWGAHWGTCLDRFGVRWMFNAPAAS